jgi:hypothetical protein
MDEIKDIEVHVVTDTLFDQAVAEIRAYLKGMNEKYKDFLHFNLLTVVDMKQDTCQRCLDAIPKPKCLRAVVGFDKQEVREVDDSSCGQ